MGIFVHRILSSVINSFARYFQLIQIDSQYYTETNFNKERGLSHSRKTKQVAVTTRFPFTKRDDVHRHMDQIDEKMLFPSNAASNYYNQVQVQVQGEQKTRRRRKKTKEDELSEMKKRRLSDDQVKFLEMSFRKERKLETCRKVSLATELGLDPKQVAVWFQNRRARHKGKQLEEEYMKLKSAHDSIVVEKCHLENEVMKLKERLSDVEEEMKKLSMSSNTMPSAGNSSPTSSFSTITYHPQPLGAEVEPEAAQDIFFVPEYSEYGYPNFLDWGSVYGYN